MKNANVHLMEFTKAICALWDIISVKESEVYVVNSLNWWKLKIKYDLDFSWCVLGGLWRSTSIWKWTSWNQLFCWSWGTWWSKWFYSSFIRLWLDWKENQNATVWRLEQEIQLNMEVNSFEFNKSSNAFCVNSKRVVVDFLKLSINAFYSNSCW